MNDSIEGIVVSNQPYQENNALVHLVTPQYGRMTLLAKGIQKLTSKNAAGCQLFHYGQYELDYKPQQDIQVLKRATTKEAYPCVLEDLQVLTVVSIMAEIAERTLDEGWQFRCLKQALDAMQDKKEPMLVGCLYISEALAYMGIAPDVDECVLCHNQKGIQAFSPTDGGFLCTTCNQGRHMPIREVSWLKQIRRVVKGRLVHYAQIVDDVADGKALFLELLAFFQLHTGLRLNSARFMERL